MVAFFGALVGKNLNDSIKDLKAADEKLMQRLDLYVRVDTMEDIKKQLAGIFGRLDDIKDSLSTKMTRGECSDIRRDYSHGK
jgi:hypothetical protein